MPEVLVLVDVQRNMLLPPDPVPDAPRVNSAVEHLLARARTAGVPVVHVRNNGGTGEPDETGTEGWELVHDVLADESVVDKAECDSFDGTLLSDSLPPGSSLAVAGMQSEYCVRATSLAAVARGYSVTLAVGAHATYDGVSAARDISAGVERELAAAGVSLVPFDAIGFSRAGQPVSH